MSSLPTKHEIDEEIQDERLRRLEEECLSLQTQVTALQDNITDLHRACVDMQRMMVKIAASQQQVIDRVQHWPFVRADY